MAKNLPKEVIAQEILIRLPMKSLVRCRCVCKLWKSLFYNPDFVSHLNQNRNRELDGDDDYIICMNDYDYDDTKNSSPPPYGLSILSRNNFSETRMDYNSSAVPYPLFDRMHLIGSVNGLVCIAFYNYDQCHSHQFILWNPTIRFFKKIIVTELLGFNYAYPFLFGFGWDSVTNDYKLIIANTVLPDASVYSCKTDCWSNLTAVSVLMFHEYYSKPAPCVIVNGSPYWSAEISSSSYNNNDIVKFDIRNNKFTYLKVPFIIDIGHSYDLINLNDHLAALIKYEFKSGADVYRFDEGGGIWVKMYAIDKTMDIRIKPLCFRNGGEGVYNRKMSSSIHMKPLCFKYGGELVFDGKRILYDPKSHTSKHCRGGSCACLVKYPKSHTSKHCRGGSCACLVEYSMVFKCRACDGSLINGFSYSPSLLALPGMKALHSTTS